VAQASLAIARLRLDWIGPPGGRAEQAMHDIGRLLRRELPEAIARISGDRLPGREHDADAVLCIPRLEFELDIDLGADPAAIVRSWARGFLEALAGACEARGVVRFPDPASHLAGFLAELAAGQAWSAWFWREFDGLRPLPLPAAARTALLRQPALGLAALRVMAPLDLQRVLALLEERDAQSVVEGVLAGIALEPPQADAASPAPRQRVLLPEAARASGAHLALFRLARGETPELSGALPARDWIERCARQLTATAHGRTLGCQTEDSGEHEHQQPGARTGTSDPPSADAGSAAPPPGAEPMATLWGGAFLLWPHLAAIPVERIAARWPGEDAELAAEALRWLALDCALGGSPAMDPVLCAALRSYPLTRDALAMCRARAGRTGPHAIAAALDAWFVEEGVAAAEWRQLSAPSATHVLKGDRQGYWLRAARRSSPHRFPAVEAVFNDPSLDDRDATLLLGPGTALLIGQLAQIALRCFAWRIPGFATASAAFLRENFLSMDAAVALGERDVDASLGAAPIGVLLGMAGISRQTYRLASGVTVRLSQGERR
jgi:hypothetical protein